jgi:HD-GYP domain-containing protein (c-di-GMP phosphodiesterase class II)
MNERDRAVLIELILTQGQELTGSDGGGLLIRKLSAEGVARLHFEAYRFDSLPQLGLPDITFGLDQNSIVGHAAVTKQPVAVADARDLPSSASFVASEEFQRRYNYRARSMLAVPMLTQTNEVLGVLFFVNRKNDARARIRSEEDTDRYVIAYTEREVRLAHSLASQAAVSIENSWLYAQIEHMLESLVTAAVSAIDARDPTTAGHSMRVATLATALAEAVDRTNLGAYRELHFTRAQMRELRFAALLHDLGKVTVREDVLVKAKKLPPVLWERVAARFDLIRQSIRLDSCARSQTLDGQLADRLRELDGMFEVVRAANEPTVESSPPNPALESIAEHTFDGPDGHSSPYLSPDELHFLRLARGTLDDRERGEIEAHVEHTRRFLAQIPWTDDLKGLVDYAYGHHERLNGTGYPLRLRGEDIPVPTRIITIADIFDALTEADRPYKPAVSSSRAIEILQNEARAGCLDGELVDILTQSEVYRTIVGEHTEQHGV